MSINKTIIDTLGVIGKPVCFQKYNGNSDTYITFFAYGERGEIYGDGEEVKTGYYIQVDVWSKKDYTNIVDQVKTLLKQKGFIKQNAYDLYEHDTEIYHKCIRFIYQN